MKAKKYIYLYVLQGNYGYGFEDLTAEDKSETNQYGTAWQRIKNDLKAYRQNERGNYRIISRRVLNDQ